METIKTTPPAFWPSDLKAVSITKEKRRDGIKFFYYWCSILSPVFTALDEQNFQLQVEASKDAFYQHLLDEHGINGLRQIQQANNTFITSIRRQRNYKNN